MHQHAFWQYLSGGASERGLRAWIQGRTHPGLAPRLLVSATCDIGTEKAGVAGRNSSKSQPQVHLQFFLKTNRRRSGQDQAYYP